MKKPLKITATLAGLGLMLAGCASTSTSTFEQFQAEDLNGKITSGYLTQKTDNLFVIVDTSSSMAEAYDGQGFPGSSEPAKFSVEKELLSRMNQTIPNIPLNTGIRSFGFGPCSSWSSTKLVQGLSSYSQSAFASALDSMDCTSGGSPMHKALDAAGEDLAASSGSIGVVIFSDGYELDMSPIPAAKALEEKYGDRLCIYGVWVGAADEHAGHYLLQQLSDISGCGFVATPNSIASSAGMANFVERVLLKPAKPVVLDSDGDGVPDTADECPDTPKGAIVDKHGCWAFHGVFFDFDKATIKPEYKSMFNNAVHVMNLNPGLTIRIEGHTDNVGSYDYNMKLSERRADAVRNRLIEMGIDPARMTTQGFGFTDPIASNATEEGRAENRRVYFSRTDR